MENPMYEEIGTTDHRKKLTLALILRLHHSVIANDAIPRIIAEQKKQREEELKHEHNGAKHGESNA